MSTASILSEVKLYQTTVKRIPPRGSTRVYHTDLGCSLNRLEPIYFKSFNRRVLNYEYCEKTRLRILEYAQFDSYRIL